MYGDALQSRGDPRGEMIALELAGERARAAELRRAHAATWWPELVLLPFGTRNGFVERIHAPVSRLAHLQPLFAREPIRELELELDGMLTIAGPLPPTLRRLATAADVGSLAARERAGIERLELSPRAVPGMTLQAIRDALAVDWPSLRAFRISGRLPSSWLSTVREARDRLPQLATMELHESLLDGGDLSSLRETYQGVEIVAELGGGPFALDLAGTTLELSRSELDSWRVEVDGTPSRVRWRRMLQQSGHVTETWQTADAAPLRQLAAAIARNNRRLLRGDELELWLPTITQRLDTLGVMSFQAYDTLWELVETARIAHDPAAREVTVTFLERHIRPDLDGDDEHFD